MPIIIFPHEVLHINFFVNLLILHKMSDKLTAVDSSIITITINTTTISIVAALSKRQI